MNIKILLACILAAVIANAVQVNSSNYQMVIEHNLFLLLRIVIILLLRILTGSRPSSCQMRSH
jgi:hypothetical protein